MTFFSTVINDNHNYQQCLTLKLRKCFRARNAYNLGSIAVNKVLRVYVKSGVCV